MGYLRAAATEERDAGGAGGIEVICLFCAVEFKGGAFTTSSGPGTSKRMRECPNGHRFEEPKKVRKQREPPHCATCSCGLTPNAPLSGAMFRCPICGNMGYPSAIGPVCCTDCANNGRANAPR